MHSKHSCRGENYEETMNILAKIKAFLKKKVHKKDALFCVVLINQLVQILMSSYTVLIHFP